MVTNNGIDSAILKAKYGSDIRKTEIHHTQDLNFNDLILMMQRIFQIKNSNVISLKYRDNEGDWITLANDDDVGFALSHESNLYIEVLTDADRCSRSSSPVNSDLALAARVVAKEEERFDAVEQSTGGVAMTPYAPRQPSPIRSSASETNKQNHQQQSPPTFGGGAPTPLGSEIHSFNSFGDEMAKQQNQQQQQQQQHEHANAPPLSGYNHHQQQNAGSVPTSANIGGAAPYPVGSVPQYQQQPQQTPFWSTSSADGGIQSPLNNQQQSHHQQQQQQQQPQQQLQQQQPQHLQQQQPQQPTPTLENSAVVGALVQPPPPSFGGGMPPQPISSPNALPAAGYNPQQQHNTGIVPPPASIGGVAPYSSYQSQPQSPYWSTAQGGGAVQPPLNNQQNHQHAQHQQQQQQPTPTFNSTPIGGGAAQPPPSFGAGAPPPPPVSSVIGNTAGNPFARTSQAPRRGYFN